MGSFARLAAAAGVALGAGLHGASAGADAAPTGAREWHEAECVAALEVQAEALAQRVKDGEPELRPQLFRQLEYGAAFVGSAYLNGERDEARSRALLDTARERQAALPATELAARQALCADEAARLLAAANALGREVVNRVARRQMARMLAR